MKKFKNWMLLSITTGTIFSLICCKKSIDSIEMDKNDKESLEHFEKKYFSNYNKSFIPDTDDDNLWKNDTLVVTKEDSARAFHTWSWQKYLHLTQNIKNSANEKNRNGLPLFLDDSKNIFQITEYGEPVHPENNSPLKLFSFHQAGSDHPVLKSNINFAGISEDYTVFYSIHMNKIMHNQIVKATESAIAKVKKGIKNISNSTEAYKNHSLELKAAWVDLNAIPKDKQKNYLIVNNVQQINRVYLKRIDSLIRKNDYRNVNVILNNPSNYQTISAVALIGLHIVGKVEGFPEMLWATFEGQDLAPDNLNNLTDLNSKQRHGFKSNINDSQSIAKTETDFLFFKKGELNAKDSLDAIEFDTSTKKGKIADKAYRKYPLGISQKYDNPNNSEYKRHADLANELNKKALHKSEIKQYYNGNIWLAMLNSKESRNVDVYQQFKTENLKLAGSPNATNSTMETYHQNTTCFSCHTISNFSLDSTKDVQYQTLLNVSHIYTAYFANAYRKKDQSKENILLNINNIQSLNELIKTQNEQKLEATFK
ncbi:hypothetical protein VUJ46_07110 [Chryseobacterium sp. MYb264]|uniref:hypothetical protein n=1 Tax=Chryseobacterium sp. MYb264 TaxID=2745153 RepID=UPI002E167DEF|nr:hypothetical protein VUJ46_07110 [Chryseobacterium sp. MYb264]